MTFRRRVLDWVPAIAVFAIGIAAWQGLVALFDVQEFLLPRPSVIASHLLGPARAAGACGHLHLQGGARRLRARLEPRDPVALVFARFRPLGTAFMPFAIAANAIPIIAFAPIMNAWFGLLTPFSKMAIAAVLCFFPVLVNTLRGLTSVDRRSIELMQSYAAGHASIFRRVRIPTSLPYIFTGLKVASVLAMIGAIVGEYFGGSFNALGVMIRTPRRTRTSRSRGPGSCSRARSGSSSTARSRSPSGLPPRGIRRAWTSTRSESQSQWREPDRDHRPKGER